MRIGQTQDLITNADMSRFSDRVKVNEGINTHRVLNGPFLSRSVYWPTLLNEQGQVTQRMKSVIVPKTGSEFLRSLADNEKEFRKGMGEKDPRSQFTPSNLYLYLIFNRDDVVPEDENPKVRVVGYKQTVYNRLIEIQKEISTKDKTKLKNGLIFMYDIQVKKTVDDPSKPQFSTKYTVDVDSENNKVMGVIPIELLDMPADKVMTILKDQKVLGVVFTAKELEAIGESETDLEAETRPNTEEEIIHKLKDNPIFVGAKHGNTGTFLFPQNEQFMQFLKNKELPILDSAAETQLPVTATPAQPDAAATPAVEKTSEKDADTPPAVVAETSPATEAKTEVVTEVTPEGKDKPIIRWGEENK